MRRLAALVSLLVVPCLAPATASGASVLNEVRVNPGLTDQPYEYVELRGVANASLAGEYLVLLEGDGSPGAGTADLVVNFATACGGNPCSFGSNELLFVGAPTPSYTIPLATTYLGDAQFDTGALENGTTTALLVYSAGAIVETTDYDTNDDGVLELPGGATITDGVAFSDGGVSDLTYAPVLAGAGSPPHAATRFPDDSTASSAAAWYFGASEPTSQTNLTYVAPLSANFPSGGVLTPGAANVGDIDDDGVGDATDNCPSVANADQTNTDGVNDGGDACDGDDDNDTVADASDNCPLAANQDQLNTDGAADGGNACDADDDNDGTPDASDPDPLVPATSPTPNPDPTPDPDPTPNPNPDPDPSSTQSVTALPTRAPVKVTRRKRKLRFAFNGKVSVTPSVNCAGSLAVTLRKRSKRIATRSLPLAAGCTFKQAFTIRAARLRGLKKVTVVLVLPPSTAMTGTRKSYTVKLLR